MPTPGRNHDWTSGPAKWFAVVTLGALTAFALGWSIFRSSAPVLASAPTTTAAPDPARETRAEAGPSTPAPSSRALPAPAHPAPGKRININTATQAELELLPGIGPALAGRIIERRSTHGPFRSVEQLDDVKGIGPKLLARIRNQVTVDPPDQALPNPGPSPTGR